MGKAVIAYEILKAERETLLTKRIRKIGRDDDTLRNVWLRHLFEMAIGGRTREELISAFANVTLINFNYDRSIELYLRAALVIAGLSEEAADRVVSDLNMIRAYGSVGPLNATGVPFGADFRSEPYRLFEVAKLIRTYTEQNVDEVAAQIKQVLDASRVIVFLGFGFHGQNMQLMQISQTPPLIARKIFATVMGITPHNHDALGEALLSLTDYRFVKPQLLEFEAFRFLENLRLSIMMASS